ncbi:EpsG family protein [Candidatus Kuenenbacteria bacterium]|nr:EpsG family protein [Candidatus Kuenenbacteria bacterium]
MPDTKKIKSFLKKAWLPAIYVILIWLIIPPQLVFYKKILFTSYSLAIYVIVYFILSNKKNDHQKLKLRNNKIFIYIILFSVIFLLLTRLIPFYQYGEAPLGYDTGFYLRNFQVSQALMSDSAYNLNIMPYYLLGMSPLLAISFMYILSQLLIAGSLYLLFRSMNIQASLALASIAIFLFVMSVTQFYAFWWMLGQQMLAMSFLFLSIALLFRKPSLAILTGCLSMLFHVPTFAVFALSFFIFFIIQLILSIKKREMPDKKLVIIFLMGVCIMAVGILMRWQTFLNYVQEYLIVHKGQPSTYPLWEVNRLKGAFMEIARLRLTNLLILPLSIYTFIQPKIWKVILDTKKSLSGFIIFLYVMFVCLLALVVFPVIYQQRFMIIFDFLLIIFATPVFVLIIQNFLKDKFGKFLMITFVVAFYFNITNIALNQKPLIDPNELTEIKELSIKAEGNATIIATDGFYTPWIYGFGGRRSYGPGWGPDPWNLDLWFKFWQTGTDEERLKMLLEAHPSKPLYLFVGAKQMQGTALQEFIKTDPHFSIISDHVWKFNQEL